MTQTPSGPLPQPNTAFERLEQELESEREKLTQYAAYLSQGELSRLRRRWKKMRQNLDAIFLNYGQTLANLHPGLGDLPPLRDLHLEELEIILSALHSAKKSLNTLLADENQKQFLLEQTLNFDENPERMKRNIKKMQTINNSIEWRRSESIKACEPFKLATNAPLNVSQTTRKVIDQKNRIEAMQRVNQGLEAKKLEMQGWLDSSTARLRSQASIPPPSPNSLGLAGQALTQQTEALGALETLFSSREKLRDARRYLERLLSDNKESEA